MDFEKHARYRGPSDPSGEEAGSVHPVDRLYARVYDGFVAILVGLWLCGGISWGGRVILRHGADPRRAALLVGVFGAWVLKRSEPGAYAASWLVRGTRFVIDRLRDSALRWAALAGCAGWAIALGVAQTQALRTPLYDVGIFHQILWGLAHGYGFLSTISKAGNFLLDHLAPSLALLTPIYWVTGSSPLTLAVVHPLLFYGGVAAWVYLAERLPGVDPEITEELAVATLIFGVSFDSLWGNLHWGFHENAIGFCALSWAFAFLFPYIHRAYIDPYATGLMDTRAIEANERSRRKLVIIVLLLIAAGSKEILLVDVAVVLGVWGIIEFLRAQEIRRGPASPLALSLLILAGVLLVVFVGFESIPHPADKNYFDRYYAYLGHNVGGFAGALVTGPGAVLANVGGVPLVRYAWAVFFPWLFLPLLWGKGPDRLWIFAIAPSFLSAALATYPPLRNPNFHYVIELWPMLATLTVMQLGRLGSKRLIWAWAFLALLAMDHDPWGDFRENHAEAQRLVKVRDQLAITPPELPVMADELAGPWISGRPMLARWPDLDLFGGNCPRLLIARVDEQGRSVDQPAVMDVLKKCSKLSPKVSVIWREEEWRAYMPW